MRTIKDKYGREIDYLRISITDNCNLRCIYCMPEDAKFQNKETMELDEIEKIVSACEKLGIKKVRLTGGEPLVRKDICKIVKSINNHSSIKEICITTNGTLLNSKINELYESGLNKVNISLDTLDNEKYSKITRGGHLDNVLAGIYKALELGIKVKLNVVIIKGFNDDEIYKLANLTKEYPIDVRFIELMPIGEGKKYTGISNTEILQMLKENDPLIKEEGRRGKADGPAAYYKLSGGIGKVGFISAMSNCFCSECNRIRVTSEGVFKQCLNWRGGLNLKEVLNSNLNEEEFLEIISKEIYNKPKKYLFKEEDINKEVLYMNEIGG